MTESFRKMYMAGVGISESLVKTMKEKVDHYAKVSEDSKDPNTTLAKDLYKKAEDNLENFRKMVNPLTKKIDDDKTKRIEELTQEVEDLKNEIANLKQTKDTF